MFYVRFLKRPSRTSEHGRTTILALITLTTDLGDDFCDEDTLLQASLYSDDSGPTSPFYSETLTWKARSRSRPVQIVCQRRPTASRIGLHVGPAQGPEAPHAVVHGAGLILPQRVIAGQTIVYQAGDGAGTASARYVERRLPLSDGYCLRVSEDSGESIARHIW